jgi:DNA-binding response OmpR family regulator
MEDRIKILVVDDERMIVAMVKDLLETKQYEVLTAYDGEEGLKKARSAQPDLILLDIMLPKLDGFKVCRLLKFDLKYRKIPILLLSARAADVDRDLSAQVGADAYMVKPFEPQQLLTKISELLKGRDISSSPGKGGETP